MNIKSRCSTPNPTIELPDGSIGLIMRGAVAIIDAADYALVSPHRWRKQPKNNILYACAHIWRGDKRTTLKLHRLILNPPDDVCVDHKNSDGLDNRRQNLRPTTRSQNLCNQRKTRGKSQFKGVSLRPSGNWSVSIGHNNVTKHLGTYTSEVEAAQVWDRNAKLLHGDFARLNFPDAA